MRLTKLNPGLVPAGSTIQLSKSLHDGKTVLLDTLTGSVVTLPAATGSQCKIRILEKIAATSNSHIIKVQNSTDVMAGQAVLTIAAGGAASAFATAASSDTITLNRTTTGGASNGARFELEDIAPGIWFVEAIANASATPATPFSATV